MTAVTADRRSSTAARKGRVTWMDGLRGVAIVLLVLAHSIAYLRMSTPVPEWLSATSRAAQPFRVPLLMFLSGTLLQVSLSKPLVTYYYGKFRHVVWPYLLWHAADLHFNFGYRLTELRVWYGWTYLWFLFTIGVFYAVAPLFRRLPRVTPVIVGLALCVLLLVRPDLDSSFLRLDRLTYYSIFFFGGYALSTWFAGHVERIARRRIAVVVAVAVLAAVGTVAAYLDVREQLWSIPIAGAGVLALAVIACRFADSGPCARIFEFVGRHSLVFYVMHVPLILLVIAALQRVGRQEPVSLALPVVVAACLAVASALSALQHRFPVAWLFAAPDVRVLGRRSRRSRPAASVIQPGRPRDTTPQRR